MTLLKDNNYRAINTALLSLEQDIKSKTFNTTNEINAQFEEINKRINEINNEINNSGNNTSGSNTSSAEINDIKTDIENINTEIITINSNVNDIEQQLANVFLAENFVEDFNTTIEPGVYFWTDSTLNRPMNYGVLLVYRLTSTSDWINQTAYGTNGKIYFRQKINDGAWRAWETVAYEDITKTYTIPDVTTATTRFIKLGTFPWYFSETVKAVLSGNNFEDTIEFNVLGGDGAGANVCGWYTTNSGKTKAILVVPTGTTFSANVEVWLKIEQHTTCTVKLTGNAKAAQYFNTDAGLSYTTAAPTNGKTVANFIMKRGFFGYNENSLNCYETTMTGLGFTNNQVVSVPAFAQAVVNYTGTTRGRIYFSWSDANKAFITNSGPYNSQLEISGGILTFNTKSMDVDSAWNTFEAKYINRLGEVYTIGMHTDPYSGSWYVRKLVDTSGTVAAAKGWQEHALDLRNLSTSNFYPVVIDTGYKFVEVEIHSEAGGASLPYNQNRIKFTISAAGWSDTPKSLFISEYNRYQANEITIGSIGYCTQSDYKAVIWLRGGIYYNCHTMNCPSAPSIKTVDTALNTSVVTVGTAYSGGTNTKVDILFTPDSTMSKGIYSSNGMTTAGNLKVQNTTTGAALSGYGTEPLSIGVASNLNVGLDYNSIQARNNAAASTLDLNYYGGTVRVNGQGNASGGLSVKGNTTLQSNTTVGLSDYGKEPLSIGAASGQNIGIDGDDIQARNNGAASTLDLNYYGGMVRINGQGLANSGLMVGGHLNIPTSAPSSPQKGDIWLVL